AQKIRILNILQHESGTPVGLERSDLNVAHVDVFDMPEIEPLCRRHAEHIGLRVLSFNFRRIERRLLRGSSTLVLDENIADLDVFHRMTGNAAENRALL